MATAQHKKKPTSSRSAARSSSAKRAPAAEPSVWSRHARDFWVLGLFVVGLFVFLAEIGALGPVGHGIEIFLGACFGIARWALPLLLFTLAGLLLAGKMDTERPRLLIGMTLLLVALAGLADLIEHTPGLHATRVALDHAGGWVGVAVGGGLRSLIGTAGAVVVLLALLVLSIILLTGLTLRALTSATIAGVKAAGARFALWWRARPRPEPREETPTVPVLDEEPEPEPEVRRAPVLTLVPDIEELDEEPGAPEDMDVTPMIDFDEYDDAPEMDEEPDVHEDVEVNDVPPPAPPRVAVSHSSHHWDLPSLDLLQRVKEQRQDRTAIDAAGDELVAALAAHGVETTLLGYTVGPTVTRFELELGPGVKVARVTSLHRDIAYAMASPDVRILAPIPGRSAIGVEVPNKQRTLVALGDLLAAEDSLRATHPLDVPLGRDISGKTVIVNLAEMPHVLISGATGAGKSSCINSLITSLVMRATPDQLRLILVDPKRVELGQYNDLPHLLSPVVVDPKKAAGALAWAVKEMERRYDILAELGVRDITSYQMLLERGELQRPPSVRQAVADAVERASGLETEIEEPQGPEELPYIVIVVDELNDLMMVAARDVEESVVRIAQMARAVGIHLVLATQRPSVDVITGVIKANIPSRMAFAVSSLADSRVILDQAGAERLIGKGDMLLLTASSNVARRLQSPWVSEEEVRRVVTQWRAQGGTVETTVALDLPNDGGSSISGGASDDDDVVLAEARRLVITTQSGSTSMLQRKLRVGFARAGRLMDQLEEEGIVAPGEGSKARKVLYTVEDYERLHPSA